MQSEDHRRTSPQYLHVHWTLCRCQQYGAFSTKALARYQIILLGEQRHIRCEQLAQGCCPNNAAVGPQPLDHESNDLPLHHRVTLSLCGLFQTVPMTCCVLLNDNLTDPKPKDKQKCYSQALTNTTSEAYVHHQVYNCYLLHLCAHYIHCVSEKKTSKIIFVITTSNFDQI